MNFIFWGGQSGREQVCKAAALAVYDQPTKVRRFKYSSELRLSAEKGLSLNKIFIKDLYSRLATFIIYAGGPVIVRLLNHHAIYDNTSTDRQSERNSRDSRD